MRHLSIGRALVVAALGVGIFSFELQVAMAGDEALQGIKPVGVIGAPDGTGERPAVAEAVESLRSHTLYHPADMQDHMPLVLWGNGACLDNGLMYSDFLREIASHGFFIIAMGYPRQEGRPAPPPPAENVPREQRQRVADETSASQFFEAIDWARSANTKKGGPFENKIDISRIAAMGHSCGGLQTIKVSEDSRITTSMVINSGVLNDGPTAGLSGISVTKDELANVQGPVAYINGGPTDIAFENAEDDVSRIKHVPVFFAYNDVGHGGTYWSPHGGDYAQIAVNWLSWQLKGDEVAARTFRGADCGLCGQAGWTVKKPID